MLSAFPSRYPSMPSLTAALAISVFSALMAFPVQAQVTDRDIAALQERARAEGWTFTVGPNPATGVPLEQLCGAREPENWRATARFDPCLPKRDLPEAFDWRELDGCTPVRDQRDCGSCWAFSTVGALECNIKIKDEVSVNLSEQWLVSCNTDGCSCDGGWYCHDYHQWKTDPCDGTGAVMEADFPYQAEDLPCDCPYPHKYFIESWAYIGVGWGIPEIAAMKQAIIDYGPISVGVYAGSEMVAYNGGIFNLDLGEDINHLVVLVGWDDNQGDSGVWIMRNSWGAGWGEDGYMRIEYGCSLIGYAACYVNYRGVQRIGPGDMEFSDIQGDNDGILEPGETIEFTPGIANLGPEEVLDVSVSLRIDDPALTITDGSTYIGSIPAGMSGSNDGDPFVFQIPDPYTARIDSFILEVTWNCGAGIDTIGVDTMVVEQNVGVVTLLVVDDDALGERETYFTGSLSAVRVPYDTWTVETDGDADSTALSKYESVIWLTGDYRPDPLRSANIAAMQGFLQGGGNLFLSGQGIAAQLDKTGSPPTGLTPDGMAPVFSAQPILTHDNIIPPFMSDYLHADYAITLKIPVLAAEPGGQVFAVTDTFAIQGYGGASNQTAPDHINAVNGGIGELRYLGQPGLGAVSYAGSYRSVFFSFGFEAIPNGDSRWTFRDTIMLEILDFFDYTLPSGVDFQSSRRPGRVRPDDQIWISPAEKTARSAVTYSYEVYDDASLTVLVAQASGQPEGSGGTTSWQVPVALAEDEDYYWRVRDDAGGPDNWSAPAAFWVNADNQSPQPFGLILPADHSIVADLQPTFVWSASTDADPYDSVLYTLFYSTDPTFTAADSLCDLTDTTCTVIAPIDLGEAATCYWMVRAADGFGGQTVCGHVFAFSGIVAGDANSDGQADVGDAVFLINYIFRNGPPPTPEAAGDANCGGQVDIGDAVYLISYVFKGGPPPCLP